MRTFPTTLLAIPVLLLATACDRQVPTPDAVDPLGYLDTVSYPLQPAVASALETGLDKAPAAETQAAPARTSTPRSTPRPRATSSTRSTASTAPRPVQTETVRHTARDAAIGAGAGAVIGAVAGGKRHRVKGAIIGASAGAVIGGVIGHTVDKKERPKY